jgi:hypothetical protein
MKKILPYFVLSVFIFATSCEHDPYADFSVSHETAYVGENVYFTNFSSDADYYEWNFGDGTFSNAVDAVHAFTDEGIYTISLSAFSGNREVDRAFIDIEIIYPVTLEVEVLEWYDKYPVRDAEVILYPTLSDWEDETRAVVSGFTDRDGIVVFSDLRPKSYFIDAWEPNHNNYILAEENVNFIRTLPLERNTINHFYAYVDYIAEAAPNRGEAKEESKKQLKIMKLERKHSETVPEKK